jgi:ketosteroid isomerase-like protein
MDRPATDDPRWVEGAFYRTFEEANADAMMLLWDNAPDICCIHPMGRALTGFEAVRGGWREILSDGPKLQFSVEPLSLTLMDNIAVSVVYERIRVAGETRARPPMAATNVYRRTPSGWRMILHHASPAVVDAAETQEPPPRLH